MGQYSRRFTISSLLYLLLGALLGVWMASNTTVSAMLRFSHIHIMMIGWVSMMIFGLGYHVIPRFCSKPLVSQSWQALHWWLSNLGLLGMIMFPIVRFINPLMSPVWTYVFILACIFQLIGIFIFVVVMLHTVIPPSFFKNKPCCKECS